MRIETHSPTCTNDYCCSNGTIFPDGEGRVDIAVGHWRIKYGGQRCRMPPLPAFNSCCWWQQQQAVPTMPALCCIPCLNLLCCSLSCWAQHLSCLSIILLSNRGSKHAAWNILGGMIPGVWWNLFVHYDIRRWTTLWQTDAKSYPFWAHFTKLQCRLAAFGQGRSAYVLVHLVCPSSA